MQPKKRALYIPVAGPCEVFDLAGKDELKELQKRVDGYIEIVSVVFRPRGRAGMPFYLVVNEDGRLKNLPTNPRASRFYAGDRIVGPVVAVGTLDGEGDWLPLPETIAEAIAADKVGGP